MKAPFCCVFLVAVIAGKPLDHGMDGDLEKVLVDLDLLLPRLAKQ